MPKLTSLVSSFVLLSLFSLPAPVFAQALMPYVLQADAAELEQQGLSLAQDAVQLARFQQVEMALSRAQLATQLAPKKFETWFLLGSLYVQTKEIDKGIESLKKAKALAPNNEGILFTLGSAYFQKSDYNQAVTLIQAGLKIKPDVPEALFDLGNAYFRLGKLSDAIAQYDKAVKSEAKFWPAINNTGLVKYEQGDIDGAIKNWRSALQLSKNEPEPELALAVALYNKGEQEQGLRLGEAALKKDARYGDLKFLEENLWGDRLLAETKKFLEIPRIQATIAESKDQPPIQVVPQ